MNDVFNRLLRLNFSNATIVCSHKFVIRLIVSGYILIGKVLVTFSLSKYKLTWWQKVVDEDDDDDDETMITRSALKADFLPARMFIL